MGCLNAFEEPTTHDRQTLRFLSWLQKLPAHQHVLILKINGLKRPRYLEDVKEQLVRQRQQVGHCGGAGGEEVPREDVPRETKQSKSFLERQEERML